MSIGLAASPQTLSFPEIPPKFTTDQSFTLQATASSGLPVTYSVVSSPAVASLSGAVVTLRGTAGSVTVKASQAGNGTYEPAPDVYRSFPVGDLSQKFVKVAAGWAHTSGIRADGTLWAWGENGSGQLGDGTTSKRSSPVPVGSDTNWASVACGFEHTLALRADGTLWTWGSNIYGQLGDGTSTRRTSPVQVGSATGWASVSGGHSHTAAVHADGTLWTWGNNEDGQLGDGTMTSRSSPAQIGNATDWITVACGRRHNAAVRADGTLWTWGNNGNAQLGDGTFTTRSSPTQVGSGTNWAAVACGTYHTIATRTDGTLWAWGYNNNGQLGIGGFTLQPTPVQVGSVTTWTSVCAGDDHTLALRTDGTLWAWGRNTNGQLGLGNTANRTSPTRVGTGTNWVTAARGSSHSLALQADGTLWASGSNSSGQLAFGYLGGQDALSPVRIWPQIATQTIHFPPVPAIGRGQSIQLEASSTSGLPVAFNVTGPATLNGNVLTATGHGSITMNAYQLGDAVWRYADPVPQTFDVLIPRINVSGTSNFGTVVVAEGSQTQTFTVVNSGQWPLNLTGTPKVAITGNHAADFSITSQPGSPVAAGGGSTTFNVTFDPGGPGLRTAQLRIASDDPYEILPFTLSVQGTAIAPEIHVSGGLQIDNGDMGPNWYDDTYFGDVQTSGGHLTHTFTIRNNGDSPLSLTGTPKVVISGTHAADFTVTAQPDSPVPALGASTTFSIRFAPTGLNTRTAVVSIANDDSDENPFTFAIQGRGVSPEITVLGNNITIANGDATPRTTDHTDFGSVLVSGSLLQRTYTIRNTGNIDLGLNGSPRVAISGAHAADFSVTLEPAASVPTGGASTQTAIVFNPSSTGVRTAVVSIANTDPDTSPYTFAIQGTGIAPEIAMDATSADFGEVKLVGNPVERSFTISNTGTVPLQLNGTPRAQISGPHAGEFTVKTQPASPIAAGSVTTLVITFAPAGLGVRNATATLTNNDEDENPVVITLQGTGIAPEINLSATNMAFGTVRLLGTPETRSFTISNFGTTSLNLTGEPKVQITGTNSGDFTVVTQPASALAAGENTTFEIRFAPEAPGQRTAMAVIASSDMDENPVQITLQGSCISPEMAVAGTGPVITHQDTTPDPLDGTDFGVLLLADEPKTQTFTITNSGSDILNLSGLPRVQITGPHAADFIVTTQPSTSVTPDGGLTTFVVTFDPQDTGTREAVVSIASNDVDENPYTFFLKGRAITPVMELSGGAQIIENDDTTPAASDGTDFSTVALMDTQQRRAFSITNRGTAVLNLTAEPRILISGAHAADFKVVTQPASPLGINESTDFELVFDPSQPGLRQAVVSIVTDDPEVETFSFAVAGVGKLSAQQTQAITFKAPGTVHPGQGPVDLTAYATSGLPVTLSVLSGPATLAGSALTLTGPGTVKVQASQPGNENYLPAPPVTATITVKPDPATLTLLDLNQTYDGLPKPVTILGTSQPVNITYQVNKVYVSAPPVNAGSYAVKAVAGTVTKTGTLVIGKAPLLVTPDDKRKFAGQPNPALTAVITGFLGTDTAAAVTSRPVLKTTATATSGGGVYPVTSSGGAAANYLFVYGKGSLVVESFAGSYEALLLDGAHLPMGRLGVTVAASSKSYSAKIELAAETAALSFSGDLTINTINETATGTATVNKLGIPYELSFVLPVHGHVLATLKRSSAAFLSTSDGCKLSLKPALYGGRYTAVLEPAVPAGGAVPAGAGWATAVISKTGVLTLTGRLGDGTSFTQALLPDVDPDPGYRLLVRPYMKARTESLLAGEFELSQHPFLAAFRHLDQSVLTWKKQGLPADASHRTSFGPVGVVLSIDPWRPPLPGTKSAPAITLEQRLGLISPTFRVAHSATGSLSNDQLPTVLQLSPGNLITVPGASNPTRWKATVNSQNGTFTGSFELTDGTLKRPVPFSGIMRQPLAGHGSLIGNGHYLLPPMTGTEKTSGEVLFQTLN